tara:strand:- start:820 stop:1005 length:186 start_codon:yes stop_codon:yes gene_type:complete
MRPFVITTENMYSMFYYTKTIYAYPREYKKAFLKNKAEKEKNINIDTINFQQLQKLGKKKY